MNYYEIGQRIREYRRAMKLSQEQLAEMVSVSVTHMSHIENGSTKLSLPVLVAVASALNVSTDTLLLGKQEQHVDAARAQIQNVLDSCSEKQLRIIADTVSSLAEAIKKYSCS